MSAIRRIAALGVVVAGLGSAIACTPKTSLTQTWQAPAPTTPEMRRVVVFGARLDQANRRALEDGLAAELRKSDVDAHPSYELFPGDLPDREQAHAVVVKNGFDGILVATLRSVRDVPRFVPTAGTTFWSGYYGYDWPAAYGSAGYVVTDELVRCEATLWDTRVEDRLVWAATTETTNPDNDRQFVKSLTRAVVPALVRAHFVAPPHER